MTLVYPGQPIPDRNNSVFLAGPSLRSPNKEGSWRAWAKSLFSALGHFTILNPEGPHTKDYDAQIAWEWEGLSSARVILFWVPRKFPELPGFTTNVEFGMCMADSLLRRKVVFGYPPDAPKMRYLHALADRFGVEVHGTLEDCVLDAFRRTLRG